MTDKEKRKDIYNIRELAKKVGTPNAYQKLSFLFKGIDEFADNKTIEATMSVLTDEYKARMKFLKSKLK